MAKILTFEIPESEVKQLEAMFDNFHNEVVKSREIMKQDQAEIERLREESRQIKKNTDKIAAETKAILDDLSRKLLKAT